MIVYLLFILGLAVVFRDPITRWLGPPTGTTTQGDQT